MDKKVIMHILAAGFNGGIEVMMANYARHTALQHVFVFVWDKGPNYDAIVESGFRTYFLDCRRYGAVTTVTHMLQIAQEVKPSLVVSHHGSGYVRFLAEMVHRKLKTCKHYYYCHSDGYDLLLRQKNPKSIALDILTRYCIRHAAEVIAISDSVRESVHNCFRVDYEKIHTVFNGADTERFDYEIHPREEVTHFVFAGRLVEEKGVQITLEALSLLPADVSWDFTVIGSGAYMDTLKGLCRSLSIEDKVRFLGNCTDVPERIKNGDIFIHSCLCEEGFGVSIVEAMAAGKICIASAAGGIPEIIEDGVDGILFEKGNPEQLFQIIMKLLNEKDSWVDIQKRAKEKAKKFSIQNFAKALDDEFMSEVGI